MTAISATKVEFDRVVRDRRLLCWNAGRCRDDADRSRYCLAGDGLGDRHAARISIGPLGIFMDMMTPLASRVGPALNRDTVGNVQRAGFRLRRVENIYLDIVKIIEAVKDDATASRWHA